MSDLPAAEPWADETRRWLFDNQHTVMLIYDPQTLAVIDANPAACRFYGYPRAQLIALKITDLNGMSLDEVTRAWHDWERDPHQPYVLKHRLANGDIRDVESYAGPIDWHGQTCQYAIVHDITLRKRAEEDLQRERNFVTAVLDTVGALVVVLDRAGCIIRFNRACERLTGYTFDEVINQPVWDILLLPEEVSAVRQVFARLCTGDFPLNYENYWITKDHRRRLIAWSNTVLADDTGAVEYVISTGMDVTERQLAEQEIRRFSSFPLLNPNPVLEVDKAGELIFCNPSALRILTQQGLTPDGRQFIPADWPGVVSNLDQWPGGVVRREVPIGQLLFAESIHLPAGFGTIRIFATDITERRQTEARLRQSNIELQARNADLDAFAHSVAHDIKNPLHVIIGYAELLDPEAAPNEVRSTLNTIKKNAEKINSITDSLMLLAEVRQRTLELYPIDMAAILDEVWPRVEPLRDEQIELRQPATWPVALGYAPWVEEVWANYLSNALKYARRPGCVELGAARESDGLVRFWVRDDGIGIAPSEQAHLFTAFYQTSHARAGGHGLGLSIVKRIVERLGGTVSVCSSGVPGEGSTFSFTLPAA